jgi:hypothetical protein
MSEYKVEDLLDRWLDEGSAAVNRQVVRSAMDRIEHTRQRRVLRIPTWRAAPATLSLRPGWAAALIAVVLIGGVLVLRSAPGSTVGTNPTATASPFPSGSGVPASGNPSFGLGPGGSTLFNGETPTEAGITYFAGTFTPQFTVRPGAGWWPTNNVPTLNSFVKGPTGPNPPDEYLVQVIRPSRVVPVGNALPIAAPLDLIGWLRARADLILSAPVPFGTTGTRVDGELRPGAALNPEGVVNLVCQDQSQCGYEGGELVAIAPNRHVTFVLLNFQHDVRGAQILIALFGPAANSPADQAVLDAFLNSFVIPRPPAG